MLLADWACCCPEPASFFTLQAAPARLELPACPGAARTRWTGFSVAAAAALGTAFTLGVVAGTGSAPPRPTRRTPVLDDAADQIAGNALKPVDRDALEGAAIRGMLTAAGDRWGGWA